MTTTLQLSVALVLITLTSLTTMTSLTAGQSSVGYGRAVVEELWRRYNVTDEGGRVDLVFVLDRSGSVPRKIWISTVNFVKNVLTRFNIAPNATRVAVVSFGLVATVDIDDVTTGSSQDVPYGIDRCALYRRLDETVGRLEPEGHAATGEALRKAYNLLVESRPEAKKAILLVTDGRSTVGVAPIRPALDIRALSWRSNSSSAEPEVELYTVGMAAADLGELTAIASPLPNHVTLLPNYDAFELFVRSLHQDKPEDNWLDVTDRGHCPYNNCGKFGAVSRCMCGQRLGQYACTCGPGYQLEGLRCRACSKGYYKGDWTPLPCRPCPENTTTDGTGAVDQSYCKPLPGYIPCRPPLPEVPYAIRFAVAGSRFREVADTGIPCNNDSITGGNSCHYECREGYRLTGNPIVVCQSSGEWLGAVPSCTVTDCQRLDESALIKSTGVANITYLTESTTFGSVVEVTCPPGFVALGNTTWTCNRHGIWTIPSGFRCQDVYCGSLPRINDIVLTSDPCLKPRVPLGTDCMASCPSGFERRGPENFTCQYDGRTLWSPQTAPSCHDVEPPQLTCPPNIAVTVADWDDDNATVNYDVHQPIVSDNSGSATWRLVVDDGVTSVGRVFGVGHWPLIYEASDAAGNTVRCTRYVQVRAKTVAMLACPTDIVSVANSIRRVRTITWPEPIFVDRDNATLPVQCTKLSNTEFAVGVVTVSCFPVGHQTAASCSFNVTVADPACPVPFHDRQPKYGSLSCTQKHSHYPRVCRVQCRSGYELYNATSPKGDYYCDWNESWDIDGPWPECVRTFRPHKVNLNNKLLAEINGSCSTLRPNIISSFIEKISNLLTSDCKPQHRCWIKEALVECDSATEVSEDRPADAAADQFSVAFVIAGEMQETVTRTTTVTLDNQTELVGSLFHMIEKIRDDIDDKLFSWTVSDYLANGTLMEDDPTVEFDDFQCNTGQVLDFGDPDAPVCYSCPVGSYSLNGTDCIKCPLGFYQDQEASLSCKACPDETNTTMPGARHVDECKSACDVGQFSENGYEPCQQCPMGTYQNTTQSTACELCPDMSSTRHNESQHLSDCIDKCHENTYSESGLEPCFPCPVGTYQATRGSTACLKCSLDDEDGMTNKDLTSSYCPVVVNCTTHASDCNVNTSRCVTHVGSAVCWCLDGFTGPQCNVNIDDCNGITCENGGSCVDDIATYQCRCVLGFGGKHCEVNIDDCIGMPCQNGGSCLDGLGTYRCVCLDGYNGTNCEAPIDDCLSQPCGDHGQCHDDINGYTCSCFPGFTGENCDKEIDRCASVWCHHGGHCVVDDQFNASCVCPAGYTGAFCEDIKDICQSNPCLNGGLCIVSVDLYICSCQLGYSGENCEKNTPVDFDLIFPAQSVTDYAAIKLPPKSMHSLTACVWIRTNDASSYGTLWSYAAESNWLSADDANVFTAYDYGNLQLFVNGHVASTGVSLNDGLWHFVCVTWDSPTGDWKLYKDGTLAISGQDLASHTFIQGGGTLVLGQEQDIVGGGFNAQESFIGEMSQFVLHDYVMNSNEVTELARPTNGSRCRQSAGTVLSWTNVLQGLHGNVLVSNNSRCLDVDECRATPDICGPNKKCLDKIGSYECVACDASTDADCRLSTSANNPCSLTNACRNGGTCHLAPKSHSELGFWCECAPGFSGWICQDSSATPTDMTEACSPELCRNGGKCDVVAGRPRCLCVAPWTGRHCSVKLQISCDDNPCTNNGTCVPTSDGRGYECQCLPSDSLAAPLAADCSPSRPCDLQDSCRRDTGTCLEVNDVDGTVIGHRCLCLPGFAGEKCELEISHQQTTTTTKPGGYCLTVDCRNGGTCVDLTSTFECRCAPDFKGEYCTEPRNKETHTYRVSVTLDHQFDRLLPYNDTFKELFRQQVHRVYENEIMSTRSKLLTRITNITQGSIKVDFNLEHTYYLDQRSSGYDVMKSIMEQELKQYRFGTFKASMNGFKFEKVQPRSDPAEQDPGLQLALYVAIGILSGFIVVAILVGFVWFLRRSQQRRRRLTKQRLISNTAGAGVTPTHVSNPMYCADYRLDQQRQQQQQQQELQRRCSAAESIYCEPREVCPYATSEDSDKDSSRSRSPSRRGNRPSDWRVRQSIPLPPKPDEGPTAMATSGANGSLAVPRCSPPPPYFPGRPPPLPGVPPPPPRIHSYINDEDADPCYFEPIGDEEVRLLSGGAGGRQPTSPLTHSDNGGFENAYLVAQPSVDDDVTSPPRSALLSNGGSRKNDGQLIEMKDLKSPSEAGAVVDEPQSPLSRQLAIEEEDDIDLVDGRAVMYAIRRPPSTDAVNV